MIDVRRNGRVAEGTPLLRVQTGKNRSRGFESLFLRHFHYSQQVGLLRFFISSLQDLKQ